MYVRTFIFPIHLQILQFRFSEIVNTLNTSLFNLFYDCTSRFIFLKNGLQYFKCWAKKSLFLVTCPTEMSEGRGFCFCSFQEHTYSLAFGSNSRQIPVKFPSNVFGWHYEDKMRLFPLRHFLYFLKINKQNQQGRWPETKIFLPYV